MILFFLQLSIGFLLVRLDLRSTVCLTPGPDGPTDSYYVRESGPVRLLPDSANGLKSAKVRLSPRVRFMFFHLP